MYINRDVTENLLRLSTQYPVVTITGPRQSGKTTLCKKTFHSMPYITLERVENRKHAENDPLDFLNQYPEGVIIDEIQRVPDLTSYIQEIVDEQNREGLFILTGSHQFELADTINQSLAGRTALVKLLPFSYNELYGSSRKVSLEEILYTGFYPRIFDKKLNPSEASSFYINTYIERDLRNLINIRDLSKFENFLRFCAARTGQILNVSSLANDCGINSKTANSWLSMLEASYIIMRLRPHYRNFNKRLIKAPKLYFWDTGLASFLLNITSIDHLQNHPLKGNLFETFIVTELLKQKLNAIKDSNLYYWRDNIGNEVDLILDYADNQRPVEIKLGKTISSDFLKGTQYYQKLNAAAYQPVVVYGGDKNIAMSGTRILSYKKIHRIMEFINPPSLE
ncbi:MAG: ATP-binding protein [Planctomycetes bacterium]|nr:ATP-binding protein [Planctomycetota bacterium]